MSDRVRSWRRIDWRRRDIRDAIAVLIFSLIAYLVAEFSGFTDFIFHYAKDHPELELDDILIVSFVLSIALIVHGYRRIQDLSREIEARRHAEGEAQKLARHDPLTGLPNRRFFNEQLDAHLAADTGSRTAVLMLDLDGFKAINDMHGHQAGDQALIQFTARVAAILRLGTTFARLGGDEFGIILPKITSLDEPTSLARRIASAVGQEMTVCGATASIGVGIGIAVAPDNADAQDQLIRRADLALYRAKDQGRSHICFFAPDMDARVERRIRIERDLRSAITADAIIPHYQPLVSLDGNRIVGFEALSRWSRNDETINPVEFIAIAEESGLIGELSDKLLRRACREAADWPNEMTLSFNISPVQLRDPSLGLRILAILGQTGLNPRRLELEITESALVDNIDVAKRVIDELRDAGVRIALDDFGTGYATLSQLMALQLDKIKIDRSFVQRVGTDPDSLVIIRAVIGLANGFGLATTAEGIESIEQLSFLKENGCTEGQGYLFGRALPASEVHKLLKSGQPLPRMSAVA